MGIKIANKQVIPKDSLHQFNLSRRLIQTKDVGYIRPEEPEKFLKFDNQLSIHEFYLNNVYRNYKSPMQTRKRFKTENDSM